MQVIHMTLIISSRMSLVALRNGGTFIRLNFLMNIREVYIKKAEH
jgi:hypothetical protein